MRPMAVVRIALARLAENIRLVRQNIPEQVKILFTVERDAYGHGLIELSQRCAPHSVPLAWILPPGSTRRQKLKACRPAFR
ncbi:MAG: hypothetical protein AAGB97_03200 [Dehalococcoidia bacterium]|nr:Alanine racemase [Chloroflexota bacterium]MBT9160315.1 Alanine racemase [Chloroflexota bacterium]